MNTAVEDVQIHFAAVVDVDLQPCRTKRGDARRDLFGETRVVKRGIGPGGANRRRDACGALHAAGVLPRVRFLGHMADVAPLFDAVDVYLASFPHSGGHSILEAMGAGKPVVTLAYPPDSHYNSGAELVGIAELIAPSEKAYVEVADHALRSPAARASLSAATRERFRAEFRPARLGERYVQFLGEM